MTVLVVRHARAGDRCRWDGPDHLRPLTTKGPHSVSIAHDVTLSTAVPSAKCHCSPALSSLYIAASPGGHVPDLACRKVVGCA